MSFLTTLPPSLRELRELRDRLADTPEIVAHIRQAEPVSTDGKAFYSLAKLGDRIEQLWQLVNHYEANVRNFGTPPAPPPKPPKVPARSLKLGHTPSRPMHLPRPNEGVADGIKQRGGLLASAKAAKVRAAAAKAPKPAKAPPPRKPGIFKATERRPEGYYDLQEILELMACSQAYFNRRMGAGKFPKATAKHGFFKLWPRAEVDAAIASRRAELEAHRAAHPDRKTPRNRPSRAVDPGPQPEGSWTCEQICTRLQRTQSWMYQTMNRKPEHGAPFPRPYAMWGTLAIWRMADVQSWVAHRVTTENPRSARKAFGSLDAGRFNGTATSTTSLKAATR